MMGDDQEDVGRRAYLGISRGTLSQSDESKKLAEVTIRDRFGEVRSNVEHWTPFGSTYVPLAPSNGQEAEVVVAYLGGDPSHPVVLATTDRRYRPKNLKPGESARYDDQRQISKIGRGGIETTGKTVTITGGGENPTTDTTPELNQQLKGALARIAQLENQVSGLHYAASRLRELTQIRVPEVAALATILDKTPAGLEAMASDVAALAQQYLQKQVQQALDKFLNPNLAEIESVLGAGVEAALASLRSQLSSLLASNPVVTTFDDLTAELQALTSGGGAPAIVQVGTASLTAQINALLAANPVIGTVTALRAQIDAAVSSAGPGLNFLEPQKRLVQGLTRSIHFAPTG